MQYEGLSDLLSPDAVWLCGHEPSKRFVNNPECRSALKAYRTRDRWRRLLSPRRCTRRLLRWVGSAELPEDYAARRAFERSMFERRPPARLVSRLVDFHVVTNERELGETNGLDFRALQAAFSGKWNLVWHRTYSFLGPYYSGRLPAHGERKLSVSQRGTRMTARIHASCGGDPGKACRMTKPLFCWYLLALTMLFGGASLINLGSAYDPLDPAFSTARMVLVAGSFAALSPLLPAAVARFDTATTGMILILLWLAFARSASSRRLQPTMTLGHWQALYGF